MAAAPHALVVGGTGMLRAVSLHLAERGMAVSVMARRSDRLAGMAAENERIYPLALDYAEDQQLHAALRAAIEARGPLAVVVAWIRPGAPKALDTIVAIADGSGAEGAAEKCRLFRVLGSAAGDPALNRSRAGSRYAAIEGLDYREIILGFRIEGGASRWNSNEEIGAGVIEAIERDLQEHVVGVLRPWEMNPRLRA